MADAKITALSADTTPTADDLVVTVNDPGGTPANRKVTLANLGLGISPAWAPWTPTLSGQFTDGDWTKASKYTQIGKTVWFHLYLTAADATPMGGGAGTGTFTLPVTSVALVANRPEIGTGLLTDNTGSTYPVSCLWASTTTASIYAHAAGGTYSTIAAFSSTVPFTWTTDDVVSIRGFYEAA